MAQYRSQWTGEVIDDAVGKAKHIEYVIAGVEAQAAFEKVDAAYGIAPVYAVYTTSENFSEISCRCVERETPSGQIVYRFEGIDSQQKQWRWTLTKSEYSVADEGGYHSETRYAWNGPFTTQMEGREATSKTVALYENSQAATQNIAKGQYVIWSSRLYTADSDITAGTVLRSAGANKNLTAVSNGGLNDLKSALNTVDESIAIRVSGNKTTYASGAAIGQYVIVDGSAIVGITDGLYKAAKAIPYNTAIDSTYLTAVSGGGLNNLMAALTPLQNMYASNIKSNGEATEVTFTCDTANMPTRVWCILIGEANYNMPAFTVFMMRSNTLVSNSVILGNPDFYPVSYDSATGVLTVKTDTRWSGVSIISNIAWS